MNINPSIFKAYDIRGIYPQDLNEESMIAVIKGIYSFYVKNIGKPVLSVALSADMRVSSPSLLKVATDTLVNLGAQVKLIGTCATPTLYFAIKYLQTDIGIQITASHNPSEWNGVKFAKRVGDSLEKPSGSYSVADIKNVVLNADFVEATTGGTLENIDDIAKAEVEYFYNLEPINLTSKFKLVSDTANAMGITYLEALVAKLGLTHIKLNAPLDGTFPAHQADPSQSATLKELQAKVVAEKADFGVATDGDGDRIVFVDEKGQIVQTSLMVSLIASQILAEHKGCGIMGNVQKILNIKRNAESFGGKFHQIRVGHSFITNKINSDPSIEFCGEISGHYFFKRTGGAESSILLFLLLLKKLNSENKPLSEIIKTYVKAAEKEETNFVVPNTDVVKTILTQLETKYANASIEKIDGVTVMGADFRINVRTSNTEPILRLNTEGDTQQIVDNIFEQVKTLIENAGGKLKTGH